MNKEFSSGIEADRVRLLCFVQRFEAITYSMGEISTLIFVLCVDIEVDFIIDRQILLYGEKL